MAYSRKDFPPSRNVKVWISTPKQILKLFGYALVIFAGSISIERTA